GRRTDADNNYFAVDLISRYSPVEHASCGDHAARIGGAEADPHLSSSIGRHLDIADPHGRNTRSPAERLLAARSRGLDDVVLGALCDAQCLSHEGGEELVPDRDD